jgi:hypothetical protein
LRIRAVPYVHSLVAPRLGNVTKTAFNLPGERLRDETNDPKAISVHRLWVRLSPAPSGCQTVLALLIDDKRQVGRGFMSPGM